MSLFFIQRKPGQLRWCLAFRRFFGGKPAEAGTPARYELPNKFKYGGGMHYSLHGSIKRSIERVVAR